MKKGSKENNVFWVATSTIVLFLLMMADLPIQRVASFSNSFAASFTTAIRRQQQRQNSHHIHYVSSTNAPPRSMSGAESNDDNDDDDGDEQLLETTPIEEFVALCQQFGLPIKGTKQDLLQRLRKYAEEGAQKEKERLMERKRRVEQGGTDDRERFEILGDDDAEGNGDEEDDGAVFYYYDSSVVTPAANKTEEEEKGPKQPPNTNNNGYVTVPPPPNVEPNENGERVVTVYSTSDQNDLTGIAASQPGQAAAFDPMTSSIGEQANAPWDANNPQKNKDTTSIEMDRAEEEISELVKNLLSMTGLPAFQQDEDDNPEFDDQLSSLGVVRRRKPDASGGGPDEFVDFDPSLVPTEMLTKASKSLRTNRGNVLREVLRKFELNAIGHDGAFGDDVTKGGGNYRQVARVRSFLEGFRRAEVRRISRETATLLLDKLVSEGIDGLDIALSSMIRSGDDTSDEGGSELNDSLLDYLNDAIRQQEKKVMQLVDSVKKVTELEASVAATEGDYSDDKLNDLWTVDEDGVETFDPSTPESKEMLRAEYEKAQKEGTAAMPEVMLPRSAPEQLLLLLKLLRERVKTEAAFSHDEKARNLRVLAYALNLNSDDQRKELLLKEFRSSLDVSTAVIFS